MKILYNFASRSRPQQFFATLANIEEMSATTDYVILCKLDLDDTTAPIDEQVLTKYRNIQIARGYSANKIDAINRDIPLTGWNVLINISDDMRFIKPGFDLDILKEIEPDCFLHTPDNYAKEKLCTMSIVDNVYYQRDKYIYHPAYYSLWCDDEAHCVAQMRGRYKLMHGGLVEHNHYSNGGASKDELYRRNDTYHADKLIYEERKRNNFPL